MAIAIAGAQAEGREAVAGSGILAAEAEPGAGPEAACEETFCVDAFAALVTTVAAEASSWVTVAASAAWVTNVVVTFATAERSDATVEAWEASVVAGLALAHAGRNQAQSQSLSLHQIQSRHRCCLPEPPRRRNRR